MPMILTPISDGMNVTNESMLSGKTHTLFIPGLDMAMINRWKAGSMIQDAMPNISADHREFIKTGITPSEWEAML